MTALSMVTWQPIARPDIPRTTFLYLLKATGANNVDTKGAGGIAGDIAEGVTGGIAE